jgi:hypothetical protein
MELVNNGRGIAHKLPTAADWFRSQVSLCEIYGEQSGIGAGFLRTLRFLLSIIIPPNTPVVYHPRPVQKRSLVAGVPSGTSLTQRSCF